MKCPACNTELLRWDRQGIEIDCCLQCRGVWLDRDELEKVIERTFPPRATYRQTEDDRDAYPVHAGQHYHWRTERKSFLGELVDIG